MLLKNEKKQDMDIQVHSSIAVNFIFCAFFTFETCATEITGMQSFITINFVVTKQKKKERILKDEEEGGSS